MLLFSAQVLTWGSWSLRERRGLLFRLRHDSVKSTIRCLGWHHQLCPLAALSMQQPPWMRDIMLGPGLGLSKSKGLRWQRCCATISCP